MKNARLTAPVAEWTVDALITVLLSLGLTQPLFFVRGMELSWAGAIGMALGGAALAALLSRRWWLVPALAALIVLPGFWILDRLKLLRRWLGALADYLDWAGQRLLLGGPEPDLAFWLPLLNFLIVLAVCAALFALVRRLNHLPLFAAIALLVDIPFLLAFPDTIAPVLPTLAGLAVLLPASLVRIVKSQHPNAVLPRAPLQWLALPVAILAVLLGQVVTPADTSRWRQQDWVNRLYDLRDFWQNQTGEGRGWQPFSLSYAGFQSSDALVGGPVRPSEQTFMDVTISEPLLLRGVSKSIYTGTSWQSPPHQVYRLDSPLWQLTRRQVFMTDLPAGADGRAFLQQYTREVRLSITPRSRLQTSLFSAGRLEQLSWPDVRFNPPYFTVDGDLFVFAGLPPNPDYSLTVTVFDRGKSGFADAIADLQAAERRTRDPYWAAVKARYLQMPEALPDLILETAARVTEDAADPYAQAVLLERYFQEQFTYTLTPDYTPQEMDFVLHLLETREGYCVHFATAMTVMARTLGLPARYVEGFSLVASGSQANSYRATGRTAHAWTEIYLQGIGWLTFDPTPAGEAEPEPEPPTPSAVPSIGPEEPTIEPTMPPFEPFEPPVQKKGSPIWLFVLAAILVLAILVRLAVMQLVRSHVRDLRLPVARRLAAGPVDCLEATYTDLLRQLALIRILPEPGETLSLFAERAGRYLRFENMHLPRLLWPVIRYRYGQYPPTSAELDALLELRLRLEARLRDSLSNGTWFWQRVIPARLRALKQKKHKETHHEDPADPPR
ncbi:MAG: transglutaminase domain-containing protein [Clostridiaceae bacterium]|nr:transglutaminase domain-containing protein [Clostridiaceae bacterium]